MSPFRRADLASGILIELERGPSRARNAALLAHFAEEAGDPAAVRRYAPIAAADAARLGAHRQAALQYDRALRFTDESSEEQIAELLEARSFELQLIGQTDRAIEDISRAIQIREQHGDIVRLGDDLRRRSRYHWIDGRNAAAEADALAALEKLEGLGSSTELAMAYSNVSQLRMLSNKTDDAIELGERAMQLASAIDAPQVRLHAMTNVGSALVMAERDGWSMLAEAEALGRQLELHDDVARTFTNRAYSALDLHQLSRAIDFAREGILYTDEHDIFSLGQYLYALRATAQLELGERTDPERELLRLLEIPNLLATTRVVCLTALGTLRARAGAPAFDLLDAALEIATKIGELQRIGPVRAARAEAFWLANDLHAAHAEARSGLDHSMPFANCWTNGKLMLWLVRAGGMPDADVQLAEPYRLEIAGQFSAAASAWRGLGFPLQQARALAAEGTAPSLRESLEILHRLDCRPDANRVAERLRSIGETSIPKGPRERTRENPAQLTEREMEVLELLTLGKSNREIAEALFISPRTCGHHVSAILAKLGVTSRSAAAGRAFELNLKDR
jgi:DNA-binding CsgD family transcriptional regulator